MKLLAYNHLDTTKVKSQFDRVTGLLADGNFSAADVKKMQNTGLYRAKLNEADRLLFKIGSYEGEKVLLLLEILLNHNYEASRFLRGRTVDPSQFSPLGSPDQLSEKDLEPLAYVNSTLPRFHVLDRIISFDEYQLEAFGQRLPLILIGSAGSGKTVLLMEKLKEARGDILYVTRSPYLAEHARKLYYSQGYTNETQSVTFSSFDDFLAMTRIPEGRPVQYKAFAAWYTRYRQQFPFRNPHMLFEEFGGVLTGSSVESAFLTRAEYLALGIRRSIFEPGERDLVYNLFEKYIAFLREGCFYDSNMLAWEYRSLCKPAYDFIAVDEIQDLTNAQVALILMALRKETDFILCGDSNQIVHPNFFSWTGLKALFYDRQTERPAEIFRVLNQNYRNAPQVVDTANQLLRIKVARFGSIDRESNYLVRCVSERQGDVELLADRAADTRSLNEKTKRSAHYAVLVLRDEDKPAARACFQTPLVFSIQEAKGLEYPNIILYNFVSGCRKEFDAIVQGLDAASLQGDLAYARAKDKTDKSLEIFKFYINALYVGITRAITRVLWVESDTRHCLFELLHLTVRQQPTQIKAETSSDDEWREEALRLEKKGNLEQAEQIRRQVLHQQEVPWTVWTEENLPELKKQALNPDNYNKKAKKQLFEYAVTYQDKESLRQLADLKFTRAFTETTDALVEQEYGRICQGKEFKDLKQLVHRYGIDYRNPLNQTPLMVAARLGKLDAVEWLIQEGASVDAVDNANLPAFWQMMVRWDAHRQRLFPSAGLSRMCDLIAPPSLNIQVDRKLIKLDRHQFDYWQLLSFIIHHRKTSGIPLKSPSGEFFSDHFVTSARLMELASLFPDSVMPAFRKKKTYCSSALSRNELFGKAPYNRKIVYRFETGYYLINPLLQIQINGDWMPVHKMLSGDIADYIQKIAQQLAPKAAKLASMLEPSSEGSAR